MTLTRPISAPEPPRERLPAGKRRGLQRQPGRRRRAAVPLLAIAIAIVAAAPDLTAQADADEDYVGPLVNQALETAKSGVEIPWSNPATGSSGTIVIERTFYRDPGTPCRDYRRTLERPGAPSVEIHGTGCRIGAGRWSLDEEEPTSLAGAPARTVPAPPAEPSPAPEPAAGPSLPSCPPPEATPARCAKPDPVVDYTLPARTEL